MSQTDQKNQSKSSVDSLFQNKYRNLIIFYLDAVIRGLISFFAVGIVLVGILVVYLHMKTLWVLPIIFIASILVSPFLSKVQLGERLLVKYENFLNKTFQKK